MKINIVGVFQRYGKSWEKAQADGCRVLESEGRQSTIGGYMDIYLVVEHFMSDLDVNLCDEP